MNFLIDISKLGDCFVLVMICTGFFNDWKKENFLTVNSKEVVTGPLSGANIIFETCSANWNIVFAFQPVN